ncbi:MAG: DUF3772 domain-containing protein [Cohaesibacter sp.]|nr:DUF3772 domain-containing protein [Cohaesibacter sp.]
MTFSCAYLPSWGRVTALKLTIVTLILFSLGGMSQSSYAQSQTSGQQQNQTQTSNQNPVQSSAIAHLTKALDRIEKALSQKGLTTKGFTQLQIELADIKTKASTLEASLTPQLTETKARLDALTPTTETKTNTTSPAAAETETTPASQTTPADTKDKNTTPKNQQKKPDETTTEQSKSGTEQVPAAQVIAGPSQEEKQLQSQREELSKIYGNLQNQLTLIRASIVRADLLANRITLALQERFTSQLFERSGTILNPILWARGLSGLINLWDSAFLLANEWLDFLSKKANDTIWQVFGMIAFVTVLIIGPVRYLLFSSMSRLARLDHPTPLQRSSHALWSILVYTLVPFAFVLGSLIILENAALLPIRIEQIAKALLSVLFICVLSYGTLRALLTPQKAAYRLVDYSTPRAAKLFGIGLLLITAYGAQATISAFGEMLVGRLETTVLIRGTFSIITAILVWIGLKLVINASTRQTNETSFATEDDSKPSCFSLPAFLLWLRPLVWLSCIIIIAAPILGYVSLGYFLAEQLGRIFLTLGLLGILTGFIDNFLLENIDPNTEKVRRLANSMGLKAKTLKQISVLFNGALRILLYCATALLIFAPWGLRSTDFVTAIQTGALQLQFGDLQISPVSILGSIVVFIIGLVLVKSIQRWMERRLLPSTNLDTGLKNSIHTSVGYVGFILAAMLAFSYMGIDLSNLALVAGALSVGIGFGMQSIVNNFVSGLILLVERPVKTGDWVVVGNDQGYVKKISVRATKIETFDRATVIVPNSELISNRVMNWMHNGSLGRIIIPVGVSYDANPEQVRDILLTIAEESEHIASYPAPSVYFMDFGASSLDFQLRCYIQDIDYSLSAKSALRFAIFKALKDANIEIPFPQQDIHIRTAKALAQKEDIELARESQKPLEPPRAYKPEKGRSQQMTKEPELEEGGHGDG